MSLSDSSEMLHHLNSFQLNKHKSCMSIGASQHNSQSTVPVGSNVGLPLRKNTHICKRVNKYTQQQANNLQPFAFLT